VERVLSSYAAHRRQIHALSTMTDASMLIVSAMMSSRPRTLAHSRRMAASISHSASDLAALSVSADGLSVSELERSLADRGISAPCHGNPSRSDCRSSGLDIAGFNQSTPRYPSLSCSAENIERSSFCQQHYFYVVVVVIIDP